MQVSRTILLISFSGYCDRRPKPSKGEIDVEEQLDGKIKGWENR